MFRSYLLPYWITFLMAKVASNGQLHHKYSVVLGCGENRSTFFLSHPCMPVNCRWFGRLARGEWKAAKEAGTPQYRTAHIVCLRCVSMGPEMTLAWPNNHFWKGQCFDYCSKCAASGQFAHDELHGAARRRTGRVVCVQEDSALCALRSRCFQLVFFPKWVLSHLSNLRLIKYLQYTIKICLVYSFTYPFISVALQCLDCYTCNAVQLDIELTVHRFLSTNHVQVQHFERHLSGSVDLQRAQV